MKSMLTAEISSRQNIILIPTNHIIIKIDNDLEVLV